MNTVTRVESYSYSVILRGLRLRRRVPGELSRLFVCQLPRLLEAERQSSTDDPVNVRCDRHPRHHRYALGLAILKAYRFH
jgi:hypothetical protein